MSHDGIPGRNHPHTSEHQHGEPQPVRIGSQCSTYLDDCRDTDDQRDERQQQSRYPEQTAVTTSEISQ